MPKRYIWMKNSSAIKVMVPDVIQNTYFSCGSACIHAVCSYWGVGMDSDLDYISSLETNGKDGTLPENIVWYAKKVGLRAKEHHDMKIKDLQSYLDDGKPVIIALQAWGNQRKYKKKDINGHYVVAIGYDDKRIYFEDPALYCKRGHLTYKQLLERWHDIDAKGNYYNCYGIAIWKNIRPAYLFRAQKVG